MAKKLTAQKRKIIAMLEQGVAPKDVAKKLRVSRQAVYNIKYYYFRKSEETGIASLPASPHPAPEPEVNVTADPAPVVVEPELSFWQRVKRVLGWQ